MIDSQVPRCVISITGTIAEGIGFAREAVQGIIRKGRGIASFIGDGGGISFRVIGDQGCGIVGIGDGCQPILTIILIAGDVRSRILDGGDFAVARVGQSREITEGILDDGQVAVAVVSVSGGVVIGVGVRGGFGKGVVGIFLNVAVEIGDGADIAFGVVAVLGDAVVAVDGDGGEAVAVAVVHPDIAAGVVGDVRQALAVPIGTHRAGVAVGVGVGTGGLGQENRNRRASRCAGVGPALLLKRAHFLSGAVGTGDRRGPLGAVVSDGDGLRSRVGDLSQAVRAVVAVVPSIAVGKLRRGEIGAGVGEGGDPRRRVGDGGKEAAAIGESGDLIVRVGHGRKIAAGIGEGDAEAIAVGDRCFLAAAVEPIDRAVGQGADIATAGDVGQGGEFAGGVGVGARSAEPKRVSAVAEIQNHSAGGGGDLLQALERPARAERIRDAVEDGGGAVEVGRGGGSANIANGGGVGVAAGGEGGGVCLERDLLIVTGGELACVVVVGGSRRPIEGELAAHLCRHRQGGIENMRDGHDR